MVEPREDSLPHGGPTDLSRVVDTGPGERIVSTWQIRPEKQNPETAAARMRHGPRVEIP